MHVGDISYSKANNSANNNIMYNNNIINTGFRDMSKNQVGDTKLNNSTNRNTTILQLYGFRGPMYLGI